MARAGETDLNSPGGRDVAGARENAKYSPMPEGVRNPICKLCGERIEPGTESAKRKRHHAKCRTWFFWARARKRRIESRKADEPRADVLAWLSELIAAAPGTIGLGFSTTETLLDLAAQGWLGYMLQGPLTSGDIDRALSALGAKKKTAGEVAVWKIPRG